MNQKAFLFVMAFSCPPCKVSSKVFNANILVMKTQISLIARTEAKVICTRLYWRSVVIKMLSTVLICISYKNGLFVKSSLKLRSSNQTCKETSNLIGKVFREDNFWSNSTSDSHLTRRITLPKSKSSDATLYETSTWLWNPLISGLSFSSDAHSHFNSPQLTQYRIISNQSGWLDLYRNHSFINPNNLIIGDLYSCLN